MKQRRVLPPWAGVVVAAFCISISGCEFFDRDDVDEARTWHVEVPREVDLTTLPVDDWPDDVPYSKLNWTFVDAYGQYPNATSVGVRIKNLHLHKHYFSFKYERNLSAWGYSKEHFELACAFVKKDDGTWIGGKFDWISSADDSRIYSNILSGYNNWNLAGVPNPCEFAFVIVDTRQNRRSNVLTGLWHR